MKQITISIPDNVVDIVAKLSEVSVKEVNDIIDAFSDSVNESEMQCTDFLLAIVEDFNEEYDF